MIKKSAQNNKIKFSLTDRPENFSKLADSTYNIVRLQIYNLETKYTGFRKNVFLGEKTLERNIRFKIGIGITLSDGKSLFTDFIATDFKDEIPYDEHRKLESPEYEFTKAKVPEVGFFERIIVPAVLVTVSAAVIVLFFMIRTK